MGMAVVANEQQPSAYVLLMGQKQVDSGTCTAGSLCTAARQVKAGGVACCWLSWMKHHHTQPCCTTQGDP